jgi:predicted small integral membrane protein
MSFTLRIIQISMVACIALFFSTVAFDNITDPKSNWFFVQHVLSMDTTYKSPAIMWRAITDPAWQKAGYNLIIAGEATAAVLCWLGSIVLLLKINQPQAVFYETKTLAFIGLFVGFILYMVGFIIIGSEWFSMWQSPTWNGQRTAGLFISFIMFIMIFLRMPD